MKNWNVTRIDNDVNGNPRRVVHFLAFAKKYSDALYIARKFGGRKYHNKSYGGGIVFQAYSDDEVNEIIKLARKLAEGMA